MEWFGYPTLGNEFEGSLT